MFGLRNFTDAQPRSKNGQPHHSTTGVASANSIHVATRGVSMCISGPMRNMASATSGTPSTHARPEAPRHLAQLGIFFFGRGDSRRLQRHAADRTRPRPVAHDLADASGRSTASCAVATGRSGSSAMPHFGHAPGWSCRISGSIGQTYEPRSSRFALRASPAGKEGSPVTDGSPDFSATAIVAVERYFPGSALNFSPQPPAAEVISLTVVGDGRRCLRCIDIHPTDWIFFLLGVRGPGAVRNTADLHRCPSCPQGGVPAKDIFADRAETSPRSRASRSDTACARTPPTRRLWPDRPSCRRPDPCRTSWARLQLPAPAQSASLGRHRSILRRRGHELLHASRRTEKICVALILRFAASLRRVHHHAADRVFGGKIQLHVLHGFFGLAHSLTLLIGHRALFTNPNLLYFPVSHCSQSQACSILNAEVG